MLYIRNGEVLRMNTGWHDEVRAFEDGFSCSHGYGSGLASGGGASIYAMGRGYASGEGSCGETGCLRQGCERFEV